MKQTAAQKGTIFTKYGVIIIIVIVVLAGALYLAGDFVYSQIRPEAPTITHPAHGTTVGKNPPTFQGEMPLGVAIKILIDGREVATRTPEAQTVWSYTPEQQLEVGEHTVQVYAVSREGLKSKKSEEIKFKVPRRPQITSIANEQTTTTQPTFEGESAPNAEVNIYIDEAYVSSTRSNDQGKWSFDALPRIPNGTHKVYVTAVETLGEFDNASETMTFTIQSRPTTN